MVVSVEAASVLEDKTAGTWVSHEHLRGIFRGLGSFVSRCLQRAVKSCVTFLGGWPQSSPSVQPPLLPPMVPAGLTLFRLPGMSVSKF